MQAEVNNGKNHAFSQYSELSFESQFDEMFFVV